MTYRASDDRSDEKELIEIRCLIYVEPNPAKDMEAVQRLNLLIAKQTPAALTLMSTLLWHGYGVSKDVEQAFALAKEASDLGDLNALVLLASMHFEGAGCERNFTTALDLIKRFNNESPYIPYRLQINEVGPGYFDLRTEFMIRVNGSQATASIEMLEKLVLWFVKSKRKVITIQTAILDRNPDALGGTSYRKLPFKGAIGGSTFMLKGTNTITHVGLDISWIGEQIWFDTSLFCGWPKDLSFGDLNDFEFDCSNVPISELKAIQKAFNAHMHTGKTFVLKLHQSSVHRTSTFYCGDDKIMTAYED
jgi:hypothetical protein